MWTRRHVLAAAAAAIALPRLINAAADPADVAALRTAGGKVTETAGVPTKLEFRDCSKLGDADLARIGRLTSLRSITLYGKCAGLNDQTLPLLAGLKSLEELSTDGIYVSDDGLQHFRAFTALKSASFFHPSLKLKGFNGSGFANLKELPNLQRLTVAGTSFDDAGMAAVARISQLQSFRTWHTYQTPAGNASLAKLPNLKDLRFGQRLRRYDGKSNALSLTDAAIDDLAKIAPLESLLLDEARLSYAGLIRLKALANLKSLSLERILIAPEDVEKLKAGLPNVKVAIKPVPADEVEKLEKFLKV